LWFVVVRAAVASCSLLAKQSGMPLLRSSGTCRVFLISCFDQAGMDPTHRLIEGSPKKLARGSLLIEALIGALIEGLDQLIDQLL
jgi:hypothetical protein